MSRELFMLWMAVGIFVLGLVCLGLAYLFYRRKEDDACMVSLLAGLILGVVGLARMVVAAPEYADTLPGHKVQVGGKP